MMHKTCEVSPVLFYALSVSVLASSDYSQVQSFIAML